MSYIYWLSQIKPSEQSLVGNELFVLSQLLQNECRILPGFVLGHNLSRQFFTSLNQQKLFDGYLRNNSYSPDNDFLQTLQLMAHRYYKVINQSVIQPEVASKIYQATQQLHSDSLILELFITIPNQRSQKVKDLWRSHICDNNSQALDAALKRAWCELFSAKSLLYWHQLGLSIKDLDVAILVRPLEDAYASGTIELTANRSKIKASWGLVHSIIQGDVEPDEYLVDQSSGYILGRYLGHKNYAYRLNKNHSEIASCACLESYIPGETHTETYVLDQRGISKLLQLVQVILDHQPQIKYLVWTALTLQEESLVNFHFTHFSNYLPVTSTIETESITSNLSSSRSIPSLLNGLAASAGKVSGKAIIIKDPQHFPADVEVACILVFREVFPQHISLIKQATGIIIETGGLTSHGAIVARELHIPAIVNARNATNVLQPGVEVFLNGDDGKVYPSDAKHLSFPLLTNKHLLAFDEPIATKLMVNLSQSKSIPQQHNLPIDGVGLLRAELMLSELLTPQFLSQNQKKENIFRSRFIDFLTSSLRQFVKAFFPRPVFYRSIDLSFQSGSNSILGNRGTYSYLSDSTLFDLEIEALATIIAEGHENLRIILPFVRSLKEFKFCYGRLTTAGLTNHNSFQVWIMAEVPSVITLLPEYISAGVRGIAIGTNDLTQLILGVDRERTEFKDRGLNANHPSVRKAIYDLIAIAKKNDIESCICGQAPVDYPELIEKLITWGIDAISVEPESISTTYQEIVRVERRLLLDSSKQEE